MTSQRLCRLFYSLCVLISGVALGQSLTAAEQRLLYDPLSLQTALEQSNAPLVIDTRSKDAFEAGHIPGARWIDSNLWRDTTFTATGLTDRPFWSEQLGALGLTPQASVVVVGDALPEAARVWWLLRYLGLPRVGLLDGGQAAWVEAGFDVSRESPSVTPTQPEIVFQSEQLADIADLGAATKENQNCAILDNRSQAEYSGTRGVGTRTGHIPGATHFEWNRFVDKSGRFLPVAEIQSLLKREQVDLEQPIVAHCQTGGRSSVAIFALELAGAKQAKNYYRGWSEYSGVLTAPVEK